MNSVDKLFALTQSWWLLWLTIASFGLFDIQPISITVFSMGLLLSLTSLAGYLLPRISRISYIPFDKNLKIQSGLTSKASMVRIWRTTIIFGIIVFVIDGLFAIKAINILLEDGLIGYRIKTFSKDGEPSILYGSGQIELLRLLIVAPLTLYVNISCATLYAKLLKIKFLIPAFLICLIQTLNSLGRFQLYILLAIILFSLILNNGKLIRKKFLYAAIMFFIFIFSLSVSRDKYEEKNLLAEVAKSAIHDYHTVGFILFEKDLNDINSFVNTNTTYGRALLGGIDRMITLLVTRFDRSFESGLKDTGATRQEIVDVGKPSVEKYYNAHRTVLYLAYADGGIIGVAVFGTLFGFFYFFQGIAYQKRGGVNNYMLILLLSYSIFLSIFTSPLEDAGFWTAALLIAFSGKRIVFHKYNNKCSALGEICITRQRPEVINS